MVDWYTLDWFRGWQSVFEGFGMVFFYWPCLLRFPFVFVSW